MDLEVKHYFGKNIYITEGFDMVGKSTFQRILLPDHKIYHPRHDLTDKTVGRKNAWVIGYGIIDMLEQTRPSFENDDIPNILIDRGVFTSYVYERLYNNTYLDQRIIDFYKNNDFFKHIIGHIYIRHHDTSTAEEIFEASKRRKKDPNELSNKYDTFSSFNDYWIYYYTADQLFHEIYNKIGVVPRVFETLPDMKWEEVRFE